MIDIASLFAPIAIAALVAGPVLLVRLLAGAPVAGIALFPMQAELPWPRGVQEEEPRPWRFDLLERRPRAVGTAADEPDVRWHPRSSPVVTRPG